MFETVAFFIKKNLKRTGMRNAFLQLCLVLIGVTGVHAVKLLQTSSLHTKVLPVDAAEKVMAVHGTDTLYLQESDGEYFLPTVHPGNWRIIIEARKPFQTPAEKSVEVGSGSNVDLGEIWLQP